MPLRFEAWTYPGSSSFDKKFDIPVAMAGSAGVRELSAWADESIQVPASYSRLPDLVSETSGSWIRVYHRSTLIDEFDAARVSLTAGRPNTRTVSGPQRNGLVEGVGILPKNYPNHKEGAFDWKWGAENVLPSLDLADLGSIRAEYELYNDQTAGGTFTVTVEHGGSSDTTESLDFDVTAADLEGSVPADTGLQGLSTVNDVAVSGEGTEEDPWVITFYDPTSPTSVSVTDADGLTSTLTENEGGRLDPDPITRSKPVDAGAGSEDEHGSYGDPAVGVSTDPANLDTGADWALRVKAESRFAGSQLIVDVTPGETYSASIRVKPDTTGTFKFVIRDTFGNHIDQDGGDLTAGSYQELSIDNMVIPDGVNQVIMRIAAVDDTPANIDWFYVNWQHAELITGDPEATWTQIVRELLEEAQGRGAGEFLEIDATDSADSLGTALSTMSYTQYVGDNAHLGQALGEGAAKGFHWQVVPADEALVITPDSSTTHVIQIYKVDADEVEDLTATSGGPTVTVGGVGVSEAQVVSRRIPYTTMIGLGTGNVSAEDSNSAAETALGRIERVVDVEHLGSEDSVQDYLDAQFAEQALNLKAATATVLESASQIPGVDYGPGSKIWWQFPGILDKEARPVKRFSWTHGLTAQFRIEGSRILTGEAAVVSAVDMLLRKQGRRRDIKRAPSPTSLVGGAGGVTGAYLNLARDTTQSISDGGEAITWTVGPAPYARFAPSFPLSEIDIQQPGYYTLVISYKWNTFHGGGRTWVTRERGGVESTYYPFDADPDVWESTYGQIFAEGVTPAIPCESGDILRVYVDGQSGSAEDLASATCTVYWVDRIVSRTSGSYRETVLADEPVAYWRLDEPEGTSTATDETGSGHDGSYEAAVDQGVDGLIANDPDRAAEFTKGTSMAVTIPTHADLKFLDADFTLELWFKATDSQGSTKRLLSWGADLWSIVAVSIDAGAACRFDAYRDGVNRTGTSQTTEAAIGKTVHVVFTYDANANETKMYLNGTFRDDGVGGGTLTDTTDDIQIGRGESVTSTVPSGVIDEVAIYDKVLTDDQILNHYNVGSGS